MLSLQVLIGRGLFLLQKQEKKFSSKSFLFGFQVAWKEKRIVGVIGDEEPPVPMPNTEVKLISAENTWLVTTREDKAMPAHFLPLNHSIKGFFVLKKLCIIRIICYNNYKKYKSQGVI